MLPLHTSHLRRHYWVLIVRALARSRWLMRVFKDVKTLEYVYARSQNTAV